ncbi:unnamed protein product [Clonostachys rhizophaga]|uniref:Uncharacterized protein n=1 Tax=Clonostachys rhizophaga TaxID=160324 RepID=A0A9N9VCY8_9HYPO|nr:unnamed protein product [Clonostachys rhizophaga]
MGFQRGALDANPTGRSTSPIPSTANWRSSYISTKSTDDATLSSRAAPSSNNMDPEAERSRKPQWLNQIKDWLSVSEPSAQAMKEQRDKTYKKFGVDAKDPRAAAKLHLPIGKIPSGATTSTAGPAPEKALLRTMREKRRRRSYMSLNDTSCSLSSRGSEGSSEPNPVTPWDPR